MVSHRTTTTSDDEELNFVDPHQEHRGQEELSNVEEASSNLTSEFGSSKASNISSGYSADEEETGPSYLEEKSRDVELSSSSNHAAIENNNFHEELNSVDNLRSGDKTSLQRIPEDDGSEMLREISSRKPDDSNPDLDSDQENVPFENPDLNNSESGQDSGKESEDEYYDEDSEEDIPIDGSLGSGSLSSYHSLTESEADVLSDRSPVRIVVTSARKVERELLEKQPSFESNEDPTFETSTKSLPNSNTSNNQSNQF